MYESNAYLSALDTLRTVFRAYMHVIQRMHFSANGSEMCSEHNTDLEDESDIYSPYFTGECTCDHTREEHGWGGCYKDGCTCQAGWEE